MKVVSYYTNEKYKRASFTLSRSLRAFEIPFEVEEVTDQGSHLANCRFKAAFCLWKLESLPDQDIVWMDADCEVLEKPVQLALMPEKELSIFKCGEHFWSTVVFFKNCLRTREFIKRWIKEHETHPDQSDTNIKAAMKDIHYRPLPETYVWNPDVFPKVYKTKPVILHHALSRVP